MEKIDLVKILKDCPTGMELDCTLYDNCTFKIVYRGYLYPIQIQTPEGSMNLTKYGGLSLNAHSKCVIFPKGKTTWEGFVPPCKFKDGDIIFTHTNASKGLLEDSWVSIFKEYRNNRCACYACLCLSDLELYHEDEILCELCEIEENRLATEDEKEKLFKAIKDNGYRWDTKNKTLEKLPMFKVGDKIKLKGGDEFGIIIEVADCYYIIQCKNTTHCWSIKKQDDWELINKPNFKVGDKIKKKDFDIANPIEITAVTQEMYTFRDGSFQYVEIIDKNYVLVSNKFDINTLVPFESRVLVRDIDHYEWEGAIFGRYDGNSFFTIGGTDWKYCIPYEGNEHLLGTTDDCADYFKTWE